MLVLIPALLVWVLFLFPLSIAFALLAAAAAADPDPAVAKACSVVVWPDLVGRVFEFGMLGLWTARIAGGSLGGSFGSFGARSWRWRCESASSS